MVFELGPITEECMVDLFALELVSLLSKIKQGQQPETEGLSEITILTGGCMVARALERFDPRQSEKYLYVITQSKGDAIRVQNTLYRLGGNLLRLQDILQTIDTKLLGQNWIGPKLDFLTGDISDMILASALIPLDENPRKTFRGRTSWIES